jgi:hypothetical protein
LGRTSVLVAMIPGKELGRAILLRHHKRPLVTINILNQRRKAHGILHQPEGASSSGSRHSVDYSVLMSQPWSFSSFISSFSAPKTECWRANPAEADIHHHPLWLVFLWHRGPKGIPHSRQKTRSPPRVIRTRFFGPDYRGFVLVRQGKHVTQFREQPVD